MEDQGLEDMWFQHDEATLISRTADLAWPVRSPDLTAPDLESKVYVNKPQTIQQLKDNIRREIEEFQPLMLQDVMKNALKRAESCIANRGHHLADIIFQS
ncbi:hypothetical protein GWI33_002065 [Rhynchophorus ferrugineus]|uniref:Uncharacterized protein n=1 Tax=Rhynchophorus ferrugineus TaxID=354439 RepID=A0A834ML58_RHYFE|nr:hypothetical protein GWI33_002065 [Rhynchophorus ferrugineus]